MRAFERRASGSVCFLCEAVRERHGREHMRAQRDQHACVHEALFVAFFSA